MPIPVAANRVNFAVASAPGTLGDLVVGTPLATYMAPGPELDTVAIDGVLISEPGVGWELRNGGVYTHATTTLGRGAIEQSSEAGNAAVNFTSAATVAFVVPASIGQHLMQMLYGGFRVTNDGTNQQAVVDGSWQVLHGGAGGCLLSTTYNPQGWWSADVAGKFQPAVAGRYLVGGSVSIDSVTNTQRCNLGLRRNGNDADILQLAREINGTTNKAGGAGSVVVPFDGTTDYVQLVVFLDGAGSHNTSANLGFCYLFAEYLGPIL